MAVIIRTNSGEKVYVNSSGLPPSIEEIQLAREYDKKLNEKIKEITTNLKQKGFFKEQNVTKKWHMLGEELHFLDDMPLRLKCDPDLTYTWRILYDLAPHLSPTDNIPTDEQRASGNRNHFYVAYLMAKLAWNKVEDIGWSNWTDICGSFTKDMWQDGDRLLEWVINRGSKEGIISRDRLRKTLKALRRFAGEKAKTARDTSVLSKNDLFKRLDQELKSIT